MRGLQVYYDKSCPLCETEMRALQARGAGMALIDCSAAGFPEEGVDGVRRERMMGRMHARTPDGKWLVGLDAFEAIYDSAGLRGAARLWRSRWLRPLLDPAYAFIARHRQALSRLGLQRALGPLLRRL
ncbi:MAG TPA: DUF393 domain-containing protein [Burkholderiales bacterium]|jgi:predicted DCC family thiol-disulfide oxidoreductase YuxK|nr:DUF393 domain-containing protein [Burkholderiales bacterium]